MKSAKGCCGLHGGVQLWQMAIIKTLDIVHGHFTESKEMTPAQAIDLAILRKKRGDTGEVEVDFVGERDSKDFRFRRIKCRICREIFKSQPGREMEP